MTNKELKLLAGTIVVESEYSDSAKKQLFNFITNEASEEQIKSLILDGDFYSLYEDAKEIINKRFDVVVDESLRESIEDTVVFVNIGREVICNVLEAQETDLEKLKQMENYVVNEASNYQILSMLLEEDLPEEAENIEMETSLIEGLNEISGEDFIPLIEWNEIRLCEQQLKGTEGGYDAIINNLVDKMRKNKDNPAVVKALQNRLRSIKTKKNILTRRIGAGKQTVTGVGTQSPAGVTAAVQKAKGGGAVGTAGAMQTVKGKAKEVVAKGKEIAAKGTKFAKTPAGMAIGGAAAAALVIYAGYKIYKNYLSKAAKSCKGAPDKSACMKQFKNKAVQAQISQLRSGAGKCAKSKDPAKCKAAIQAKISSLQGKMK